MRVELPLEWFLQVKSRRVHRIFLGTQWHHPKGIQGRSRWSWPGRKKPDPDWSFNNNNNWYISWKEKTMHGYTGRSDFIKMESIDISMIYHLWFRFRFRPFFWIPNPDPTYLKTGSGSDQTPYVTESATLISGGPGHLKLNSWSIYYMVFEKKILGVVTALDLIKGPKQLK